MSELCEALVVRPGDTLWVRVRPGSSVAAAQRMKDDIQERFPGLAGVVVIAAEQIAVYRPDPTEDR